jgi:hypothetical protein
VDTIPSLEADYYTHLAKLWLEAGDRSTLRGSGSVLARTSAGAWYMVLLRGARAAGGGPIAVGSVRDEV